jgi:hypothetical protein
VPWEQRPPSTYNVLHREPSLLKDPSIAGKEEGGVGYGGIGTQLGLRQDPPPWWRGEPAPQSPNQGLEEFSTDPCQSDARLPAVEAQRPQMRPRGGVAPLSGAGGKAAGMAGARSCVC